MEFKSHMDSFIHLPHSEQRTPDPFHSPAWCLMHQPDLFWSLGGLFCCLVQRLDHQKLVRAGHAQTLNFKLQMHFVNSEGSQCFWLSAMKEGLWNNLSFFFSSPCFCSEFLPWLGWDFPIPALGSMWDMEHLGEAAHCQGRKRLNPSGGVFPRLLSGFSFVVSFVYVF